MKAIHKNVYKNIINIITHIDDKYPDKKIVWCGENKWLFSILGVLETAGIRIDAVIDNSPLKIGIETEYYSVKSFDYAAENKDNAVFVICSLHCPEMYHQLLQLGVCKDYIFTASPIEYEIEEFDRSVVHDLYDRRTLSISELQKELFDMLVFFRNFCDSHGLRYFLYDGTLIGAVRHKGFIPWDDDVDVAMPYEDFLRLCECFDDNDDYSLLCWERDDNYEYMLPRIVSNKTRIFIPEYSLIGCFLDIFLIGGYPTQKAEIELKWQLYKDAEQSWYKYWILRDTDIGCSDERRKIFKELFNIPFDEAEYVGVMRTERQRKWTAPREWFSDSIELEFCGQRFKAPSGYDPYLKMKYGDYMKVPDVNSRETHGLVVWKDFD